MWHVHSNTQPRDGHYKVPEMCTYFNVYNYWTSNHTRYVIVYIEKIGNGKLIYACTVNQINGQ